ncbi:hypothetical protein G6F63_015297 [Rhizopus arrhizus]|nr:hypothetical protein G6F63_015297 [Rhizopus arrhizus]
MVADCGSFTTAATRLHSTQSTVSQKVRRLEELAGHRLLARGHRDVHPTDAGHTLLGYARRMLDLNEEMAQALAGATVETAPSPSAGEAGDQQRTEPRPGARIRPWRAGPGAGQTASQHASGRALPA